MQSAVRPSRRYSEGPTDAEGQLRILLCEVELAKVRAAISPTVYLGNLGGNSFLLLFI